MARPLLATETICRKCSAVYAPEENYEDCPTCAEAEKEARKPVGTWAEWSRDVALVESLCERADSQAPVANEGVPVRVEEEKTERMLAIPSNRELMAHLAQRAEAGQGDDL